MEHHLKVEISYYFIGRKRMRRLWWLLLESFFTASKWHFQETVFGGAIAYVCWVLCMLFEERIQFLMAVFCIQRGLPENEHWTSRECFNHDFLSSAFVCRSPKQKHFAAKLPSHKMAVKHNRHLFANLFLVQCSGIWPVPVLLKSPTTYGHLMQLWKCCQ